MRVSDYLESVQSTVVPFGPGAAAEEPNSAKQVPTAPRLSIGPIRSRPGRQTPKLAAHAKVSSQDSDEVLTATC
jgi:hypothetical protein